MTITVTDIHDTHLHDTHLHDRAEGGRRAGARTDLPRRGAAPVGVPFDDERPRTDGALALKTRGDGGTRRRHVPHLRVVGDKPLSRRVVDDQTLFGRQPTATRDLPDAKAWAGQLAQAVAEVLSGDRPLTQLMRWTDESVFSDLSRRAAALARAGAGRRGPRNLVGVRSVHVCLPRDGVAEASVHVRQGHRSRILALRLEGLDGRWRCTALELA